MIVLAHGDRAGARNRLRPWAQVLAISLWAAACGQPAPTRSQAAISPPAAATPTAGPVQGNPAPGAAATPANSGATADAVPGFPPPPATPPFSERFNTYPVSVFKGPIVFPDFAGAQKPYANFRTRLTDAAKGGVNFAGHYALVQFGCGMGCTQGYMIDLTNGQIAPLPLGELASAGIEYASRPDSNLLQTVWRSDMLLDANGNQVNKDPTPTCVFENVLFQGGKFTVLDQNKTATLCP